MSIRLGQHFLKNQTAINKIIAALDIQAGDKIIEIGPGKGELTLPLAENFQFLIPNLQIIAIEKDNELATELKNKIQNLKLKNTEIIEGDALKILTDLTNNQQLTANNYKIVGNIPYYITGKLLRIISELENKPVLTVLMIQKEVAERLTAVPPKTNLLSAATQFWAKPEIVLKLKPSDFEPAPEVDSAVIKLTTLRPIRQTQGGEPVKPRAQGKQATQKETENYYKLIHIIFKQPRKTLINNLKEGINAPKNKLENALKTAGLPLKCRPQNLSIENIVNLLCFFKDYIV